MSGETNLFGVYLHAFLVTAVLAFVLTLAVHRLLVWLKVYRHVWHPALFETAVFVTCWALVLNLPEYARS